MNEQTTSTTPFIQWAVVLVCSALLLVGGSSIGFLSSPPVWLHDPVVNAINAVMDWFVTVFDWLFGAISVALEQPMLGLQWLLQWLPWSATLIFFAAVGYAAGGASLAAFALLSLLYMLVTGYWQEGMNTLALVGVSVPLSVFIGFWLGVWGYRSKRAERIIQPTLDVMQTVPTFAYLIPILLLFGFGPVVGLIASAIYACPPMVRNTLLGLRRVSPDVLDSGLMSGATRRQRFWWVEVPTALPQIMIGVNQTTMAALSMVIIAAIIGGFDDIGWEVLSTMRKAQFGQSLLSGIVIVLIAMMMDRISRGFTSREKLLRSTTTGVLQRYRPALLVIFAMLVVTVLSSRVPVLASWPAALEFYPADSINNALSYVVRNFGSFFESVKRSVNFFFLLPMKIGLLKTIRPMTWGFEFTQVYQWLYWGLAAVVAGYFLSSRRWRVAVFVVLTAMFLFFGLTNLPWPIFFMVVGLLAWQAGGMRLTLFAIAALSFILLTGVWKQAMLSIYLCGAAVLFSFVVGGALGIWGASSQRVSNILRPINDTLQTLPQFVYLIPVLFLFQIGDFTALIAVIAYAIVPMIRYTEHGIRAIRQETIEAARAMGCTRKQMLFDVQLPIALPEIMLGLNQTIMFGLAMLVIAALVGTRDLGQSVYIALGQADAGKGLVAGVSIALIAMVSDRIIQSWADKRRHYLEQS